MASGEILNLEQSSFDQTVNNSKTPVLVDFWAPWCGPCKTIAPILDELSKEMEGEVQICKVNVDDNQELAVKFGVRAIPTIFVFNNGKVVDQVVGMISKTDLQTKIQSHI